MTVKRVRNKKTFVGNDTLVFVLIDENTLPILFILYNYSISTQQTMVKNVDKNF